LESLPDGRFIAKWGIEGELDAEFLHPHGLDVDSAGNVYATDAELLNIQKFTSGGEFVTLWGGIDGIGPSEFSWLESVDVDSAGNVYVADMKNHRIQSQGLAWFSVDVLM